MYTYNVLHSKGQHFKILSHSKYVYMKPDMLHKCLFFFLLIIFYVFCNLSLFKTSVHVHKTQKPGRNRNLEKLRNTNFWLLTDNLSLTRNISFIAVFLDWLICYENHRHVFKNLKLFFLQIFFILYCVRKHMFGKQNSVQINFNCSSANAVLNKSLVHKQFEGKGSL